MYYPKQAMNMIFLRVSSDVRNRYSPNRILEKHSCENEKHPNKKIHSPLLFVKEQHTVTMQTANNNAKHAHA